MRQAYMMPGVERETNGAQSRVRDRGASLGRGRARADMTIDVAKPRAARLGTTRSDYRDTACRVYRHGERKARVRQVNNNQVRPGLRERPHPRSRDQERAERQRDDRETRCRGRGHTALSRLYVARFRQSRLKHDGVTSNWSHAVYRRREESTAVKGGARREAETGGRRQ